MRNSEGKVRKAYVAYKGQTQEQIWEKDFLSVLITPWHSEISLQKQLSSWLEATSTHSKTRFCLSCHTST